MGTQYRVDRTDTLTAPCGMSSIVYLGDSLKEARQALINTDAGRDAWNQPNDKYGVVLFEWNQLKYDYVPKAWHGMKGE